MTPLRKYNYRRNLPHFQKDKHPLFISFSTSHWWVLPDDARDCALRNCLRENGVSVDLYAVVIMPNHVHMVLSVLRDNEGWPFSIPEIMRRIKGRSAIEINRILNRSGPVWNRESFDHVIRHNESLEEKIDYVVQNPVRAGLVKDVSEYPWVFWKE